MTPMKQTLKQALNYAPKTTGVDGDERERKKGGRGGGEGGGGVNGRNKSRVETRKKSSTSLATNVSSEVLVFGFVHLFISGMR